MSVNPLFEALRPHQWAKNLLVVVPALLGQVLLAPGVPAALAVAFAALCLVASGNYLLNDLLDLPADREHPARRHRPLAAGRLSPRVALVAAPILIGAGLALGTVGLGGRFGSLLTTYLAVALTYSAFMKRYLLVDVVALAGLYALRLLAGGVAAGVPVSSWLLIFSLFFFVSLALAKRLTALDAPAAASPGGTYRARDRDAFAAAGPATGLLSILVLALYVSSDVIRARYTHPDLLWLLCPLLLYWVLRLWFIALRHELPYDPVVFALRDRASWMVLVAVLGVVLAAAG